MSAAEVRGIYDALKLCWNPPGGADKLPPVEVRVFLDAQGAITGSEAVDPTVAGRSRLHELALATALRATANQRCRQLPATLGDIGHMIIVFDPEDAQ